MIVIGTVAFLALFLFVGWIIATDMFQHRIWRRRVEQGDTSFVAALIEEAMSTWRSGRPPRGTPAALWAGVQGTQLVAVDSHAATVSAAAESEFRTEGAVRVQVASATEEAAALAARLVDMMLFDVPNVALDVVRVDIYSTFVDPDGARVQRPILTTTATRASADAIDWEALAPHDILNTFDTTVGEDAAGRAIPIELPPPIGDPLPPMPGAIDAED